MSVATHCPNGHEYTPENIYARRGRECRACRAAVLKRRRVNRQENWKPAPICETAMTPNWNEVVNTLRETRKQRGITQQRLSANLGVDVHRVYKWEKQITQPSFAMFLLWAAALDFELSLKGTGK